MSYHDVTGGDDLQSMITVDLEPQDDYEFNLSIIAPTTPTQILVETDGLGLMGSVEDLQRFAWGLVLTIESFNSLLEKEKGITNDQH